MRAGWRALAPVVAIAATGCLASRGDILLLQDEIRTMRATQVRSDSLTRLQTDSVVRAIARTNDSLRALAQRFGAFQANVVGELFELNRQLITLQELAGMSSKRIMELRSSMEERAQSVATPPTGGDSAGPEAAPGPAQLYTMAYDQWTRGSFATARSAFQELLRRYPNFDQASAAQLYIAQCYAQEKRIAEADSVYGLVVKTYPKSIDAPTALYKYGLSQLAQGKKTAAREALQRVARDYPQSIEAQFATERLKEIR